MKRPAHNAGSPSAPSPFAPEQRQKATITLAVLAAHAGLLAWLQTRPAPAPEPRLPVVMMELLASSPTPVQASTPPSRWRGGGHFGHRSADGAPSSSMLVTSSEGDTSTR